MIVDLRTYTFHPGRMQEWVALYEKEAWPLQKKYLGKCLGFYTSIEGRLHTLVHLWEYESQADRETRRNALYADPAWGEFLAKVAKLGALVSQENTFLKPVPFAQG